MSGLNDHARNVMAAARNLPAPAAATTAPDVAHGATAASAGDSGSDLFDPADASVPEVLAYLADADPDEAARVRAAEADGKARKSLLG